MALFILISPNLVSILISIRANKLTTWVHVLLLKNPGLSEQVYRFYPRWQEDKFPDLGEHPFNAGANNDAVAYFKIVIARAHRNYDKNDWCATPQDSEYTGFDSTYAFEPRGFRISKLLYCGMSFSIRLVNFKSWLTPHEEQGEVAFNCHELITIAMDLTRAIEVEGIRGDKLHLGGVSVSGIDASHYIPREQLDSKEYRVWASSWWGQDRSWEIILGQEGPSLDPHDPRDFCSKMAATDYVTVSKPWSGFILRRQFFLRGASFLISLPLITFDPPYTISSG